MSTSPQPRPEAARAEGDGPVAESVVLGLELRRLRLRLARAARWVRERAAADPLAGRAPEVVSDAALARALEGQAAGLRERFFATDPEACSRGRAFAAVEAELATVAASSMQAGAPPALDALARLFGLRPFERELVLLCLAPEIEPALLDAYAYVQDDPGRRHATAELALALFEAEPTEALQSLLPAAPLRRFRLLELGPAGEPGAPLLRRPLCLPARVTARLLGLEPSPAALALPLRPVLPGPLAPAQAELAERLAALLGGGAGPWPVVNLVGCPGSGRATLARALCDWLGCDLLELDGRGLAMGAADSEELLRHLEREVVLRQAALLLALDGEGGEPLAGLGELIERQPGLLFVTSREPRPIHRPHLAVRVPDLDGRARAELWRRVLPAPLPAAELRVLAEHFAFGARAVAEAAAAAATTARLRAGGGPAVPEPADLWQACRERAAGGLEGLAQRIRPAYGWNDIVLPAETLAALREIAAQVENRARVYDEWGFGAKLVRGRGIAALFSGPSGTGKTMAAEILAGELRLELFRVDLAGVVSKYIGETEKNLRRCFEAAEQAGAVLFFDEADALFGRRAEVKDSHDRYANLEIDYLLQRMEDYRGLAILATNRRTALDRAFLRRLRFLVEFPFPDAATRRRIWRKVFPPGAPLGVLDWDALARLELAGGNIRTIALNAAFLAAADGARIGMTQVMHAARAEYQKCDKAMPAAEFAVVGR